MKELSHLAQRIEPSATLSIDSTFKKMLADGQDAIGFAAGEPDFNTPEHIKEAGKRAIDENFTRYTPAAGILPLRKAIAHRLRTDYNVFYDPTQIVTANGAKSALFATLCVLLNPGDEVILPAPYWTSYDEMIRMAGGIPVVVHTREEDGFKMSPEALRGAISEKTKALMFNNPSNPTGAFYDGAETRALCEVCVEEDIYIIADEIYCGLVYDNKEFVSVASLGDPIKQRTVLINGVSKSYAMTGWRLGYAAANETVSQLLAGFLSHTASAPSSITQKAAQEALEGPQEQILEMKAAFEQRRNYFFERMNQINGVSCIKPEGAFYIMMNCSELFGREIAGVEITTALDFAAVFLQEKQVAVVPCESFGAPQFVRWSYATSMASIKEGLHRLEALLHG